MHAEKTLQNCRFCKSPRVKSITKRDDILIFKCRDCGIVFLANQLDEEAIKGLYKYYSSTGVSNYLSPVTRLRYEKLLDDFEKYRKNNALIDVGCGAGYFLLSASDRGWQAEGTEISDEAIKLAQEKAQCVFKGDIKELELEKDSYDVAILMEFLEHASDPEGIIRKLSYVVRPGGMIYITTPNYNSLTRRLLGKDWGIFNKEHFFYFTHKDLKLLLKCCGFKIKKIKTESLSIIEISRRFKKPGTFGVGKAYEKQEILRDLTEKMPILSAIKRFINFILNISKTGDVICVLAGK